MTVIHDQRGVAADALAQILTERYKGRRVEVLRKPYEMSWSITVSEDDAGNTLSADVPYDGLEPHEIVRAVLDKLEAPTDETPAIIPTAPPPREEEWQW